MATTTSNLCRQYVRLKRCPHANDTDSSIAAEDREWLRGALMSGSCSGLEPTTFELCPEETRTMSGGSGESASLQAFVRSVVAARTNFPMVSLLAALNKVFNIMIDDDMPCRKEYISLSQHSLHSTAYMAWSISGRCFCARGRLATTRIRIARIQRMMQQQNVKLGQNAYISSTPVWQAQREFQKAPV